MNVAVLYADEAEWKNAYPQDNEGRDMKGGMHPAVAAIESLGHAVTLININSGLYEALKGGGFDIAFNLADDGFSSKAWTEPHVVAMLDVLGVPYTGCGFKALTICLDKAHTKKILAQSGLPTPKFYVAKSEDDIDPDFACPAIVKPLREDGSIGVKYDSVASNKKELHDLVKRVIETYKQPALVERFIDGREFNVALVGNEDPEVLPVSEIRFEGLPVYQRIVSYEAKWVADSPFYKGTVPECPAKIDAKLAGELGRISKEAYTLLELSGYGRVDLRVDEAGPQILEVNPNPDIDTDAGLPRAAKAAGMSYEQLIARIIDNGLKRR